MDKTAERQNIQRLRTKSSPYVTIALRLAHRSGRLYIAYQLVAPRKHRGFLDVCASQLT